MSTPTLTRPARAHAERPAEVTDKQAGDPAARLQAVVTNQKGGQSKTTTAVNLAAELAALGWRSRILDCDPQKGSATWWLPPQWDDVPENERYTLADVLLDEVPLDRATWPTTVPGLHIVPSFHNLVRFETERPPGSDMIIRQALADATPYDADLVDCAPNLGSVTVSAIVAADDVIVPVVPGGLDLAGVADLYHTLEVVRKRLNPNLRVRAVLACDRYESRLTRAIEAQLQRDFPDALHKWVRHTVRVREAPLRHQTLRDYAPHATATADYRAIARLLAGLPEVPR